MDPAAERPFGDRGTLVAAATPGGIEMAREEKKGLIERLVATGDESVRDEAPKATKLLKEQHDQVRDLFKQFKDAGEGAHATRKKIIDEASRKLEVHAQLEERIFYPACQDLEDEKARKMVGESLEEHLIVKRLIKELQGLRGTDEKFEAKAVVLKESVEHHADEEEDDLFPAVEKEMDDDQLRELGRQMKAMETRLTSGAKPAKGAKSGRQAASRA
jgi:hemerythrin-like domain-containing protein